MLSMGVTAFTAVTAVTAFFLACMGVTAVTAVTAVMAILFLHLIDTAFKDHTKILATNTLSGKLIRGFAASEQFFVMLSLGIFFITKVKNVNLKKKFFNVVQALLNDFNTPLSLRLTVKRHRISFIKMIDIFDKFLSNANFLN